MTRTEQAIIKELTVEANEGVLCVYLAVHDAQCIYHKINVHKFCCQHLKKNLLHSLMSHAHKQRDEMRCNENALNRRTQACRH